jgi:LmbE family N-acetylglucosaminyl deacetylase
VIELGQPLLGSSVSSILCLGAHADDIEIGCGGFLLRLLQMNPGVRVTWVVLSGHDDRATEARLSAERVLKGAANVDVLVKELREGYFPYVGLQVKEVFDALGREVAPDLVLTHYGHDLHQDHRVVCELTWNTFRDHLILEYEIPKYDGDLGSPNVFMQLDAATCERKIDHLLEAFPSQRSKPWFTRETFWATLRLRGIECRSRTGFAEGFFCRKLVLA